MVSELVREIGSTSIAGSSWVVAKGAKRFEVAMVYVEVGVVGAVGRVVVGLSVESEETGGAFFSFWAVWIN